MYGQVDSDFISPGDFVDRKPTLPEVVLPNFVEDEDKIFPLHLLGLKGLIGVTAIFFEFKDSIGPCTDKL